MFCGSALQGCGCVAGSVGLVKWMVQFVVGGV